MDVLMLFKTSLTAMFPLLSISFTGAILTFLKIMDPKTNDSISVSVAKFFMPILNFSYISSSLNLNELALIWPVLVGPLLFSLLFIPLGYLIAKAIKVPKTMRNTFTMFFALPNYGLVFTLSKGICSPYGPLSQDPNCPDAFSYTSIFGIAETLIFWIIGYPFFEKDRNLAKVADSDELLAEELPDNRPSFIKNICNTLKMPNPLSCFVGLLFAMIPGFKELFFRQSGLLFTLGDISKNISFVGIVWGQMMMGSNIFMMIGKKSKLRAKQIVGITVSKVMLLPGVSLGIIYFLWEFGIFDGNRVQAYILYMCVSCPTAIVTIIFAMLLKVNLNEVSQCFFSVYIISIFTMVLWTFLFFTLIT